MSGRDIVDEIDEFTGRPYIFITGDGQRWTLERPTATSVYLGGKASGIYEPPLTAPQQRALPRPSTTPPMWANNPAGSRRPKKTRNSRRVK